ncbi:MAG: ABC-type transport auxiliary lipoprotein family protein [Ahrensia sp.]|nr:ABC-type transport auxiliary lipoprotein family protein [Ahrensia sp.]
MAIVAGVLHGCAALGGTEATTDTYELATADVTNAQAVRRGAQILIAEPVALKALDSENIVVETAPLTIQYLDAARWSDRLPRVVQQKLAGSFESSNRFSGVGLPGQGLAIDYQLITEIRDFSIDGTRNIAEVKISVKLLNDRTGGVISAKVFEASRASGSSDQGAYVRALNAAFSDVSEEIVIWVASKV